MPLRGRILGTGLLLAIALTARPASADSILYTSFGPGASFQNSASFFGFEFGEEGSADRRFARAFPFVPGSTAALDDVALALEFPWSFSNGTLIVNLFAGAGSLPGSLLETWTATSAPRGVVHFASSEHPVLAAGTTYFLEATTTGIADGLWFLSPQQASNLVDVYRVDNGPWRLGRREFNAAFAVTGTAVTPEPAALLLVGPGIAWMALRRRRRSKQLLRRSRRLTSLTPCED
jgi:hypothetical protein